MHIQKCGVQFSTAYKRPINSASRVLLLLLLILFLFLFFFFFCVHVMPLMYWIKIPRGRNGNDSKYVVYAAILYEKKKEKKLTRNISPEKDRIPDEILWVAESFYKAEPWRTEKRVIQTKRISIPFFFLFRILVCKTSWLRLEKKKKARKSTYKFRDISMSKLTLRLTFAVR